MGTVLFAVAGAEVEFADDYQLLETNCFSGSHRCFAEGRRSHLRNLTV